jgi:hypothetical protein
MEAGSGRHASDDVLERYSMGRLDAAESQALEEHLLICAGCQDNLALTDAYLKSMWSAAVEVRLQAIAKASAPDPVKQWFRGLFELRKPAWILGMAALALVIAAGSRWPPMHRSTAQPALVLLQSHRGAESPLNSSMPKATPFTLMLDLTDLPALPQYRLEIVDAAGRAVFGSRAAPENNRLRATIAKGLPGGMYYVRVYGHELLREYGLQARD